jgi:tol-pal system protein YbgF
MPIGRTDTDPGQFQEVELAPTEERAGGARQIFDTALTQFQRGQHTTARRAFQDFLRSYPDHALAPDAHYYLALILVQEGQLREAIQGFLEIPQLFPTAEKVPEALYQVGVAYIDLDELDDARVYLQRVVNTYPDTEAADQARERLAEIG